MTKPYVNAFSDLTWIKDHKTRRLSCLHPEWALCLGGAYCVWEDILAFEKIYGKPWDGLVIAANDIGCHWPRDLDHWVSLHAYKFEKWIALRKEQGFEDGYVTWGCKPDDQFPDYRLSAWGGGSSGMFAAQVALELGCTRVVLMGIPMTQTPHFAETKESFHVVWVAANAHWRAWGQCRERFGDNVRSMSGKTRELFGEPTTEWLGGSTIPAR